MRKKKTAKAVQRLLDRCETLGDPEWALVAHRHALLEPYDSFSPRLRRVIELRPDARRRYDEARLLASRWWEKNRPGFHQVSDDYLAFCWAVVAECMVKDIDKSLGKQMRDPLMSVLDQVAKQEPGRSLRARVSTAS